MVRSRSESATRRLSSHNTSENDGPVSEKRESKQTDRFGFGQEVVNTFKKVLKQITVLCIGGDTVTIEREIERDISNLVLCDICQEYVKEVSTYDCVRCTCDKCYTECCEDCADYFCQCEDENNHSCLKEYTQCD
jgi:hypothetical protein